jgi:hypothetical protein
MVILDFDANIASLSSLEIGHLILAITKIVLIESLQKIVTQLLVIQLGLIQFLHCHYVPINFTLHSIINLTLPDLYELFIFLTVLQYPRCYLLWELTKLQRLH